MTNVPAEFYSDPSAWNHVLIGGCVIRFDTKNAAGTEVVPHLYANEAHTDIGATGLFIDDTQYENLIVRHDHGLSIVGMAITPDETLTKMGVTCGGSGGASQTKIPMYLDGVRIPGNDVRLFNANANLWCMWAWFSPDASPIKTAIDDLAARVTALEAETPQ